MVQGQIIKTTQKTIMNTLPRLIVIAIGGALVAMFLGFIIGWITGAFTGIGDFGVALITTIIALVVYSTAMGMSKNFNVIDDLIPVLIVSPLVVAGLAALNLGQIPVIDSTVELGAGLGIVVASIIFANSFVKQMKLFK